MPRLELTDRELVVHLTPWDSIWSLRRGFRVPLAHIRGAAEDDGFDGRALGLRLPGTYFPGLIAAGTFIKGGDKQFVYTSRKLQTIVTELARNDCAPPGDRSVRRARRGSANQRGRRQPPLASRTDAGPIRRPGVGSALAGCLLWVGSCLCRRHAPAQVGPIAQTGQKLHSICLQTCLAG
uniref:hypothetical protein n=1 Tax=Cupriavidus taiwanensis TaxID=164546 RepID=UPI001E4FB43E|nr:hypothetical protein [Cupriavidus taiwanensis]